LHLIAIHVNNLLQIYLGQGRLPDMDSTTLVTYVNDVLAKLRAHGNYGQVAKETGISLSWMYQFSNGKIQNPGLGTIRTLAEWLEEKQ
jgi:DNA-binding phage protein